MKPLRLLTKDISRDILLQPWPFGQLSRLQSAELKKDPPSMSQVSLFSPILFDWHTCCL